MSRRARQCMTSIGAALCAALIACGGASPPSTAPAPASETIVFAPSLGIDLATFTKTKSGAWYRDVVRGTGAVAALDRTLTMKYVVSLPSGSVVETQAAPVELKL